eukprot:gene31326-6473_t
MAVQVLNDVRMLYLILGVLTAAFSRLTDLMFEIIEVQELPIPKPLLKVALVAMKRSVRKRAGFEIDKVTLAAMKRSVRKRAGLSIASLKRFEGVHSSRRQEFFYNSAYIFFHNTFQLDSMLEGGNRLTNEMMRAFDASSSNQAAREAAARSAHPMSEMGMVIASDGMTARDSTTRESREMYSDDDEELQAVLQMSLLELQQTGRQKPNESARTSLDSNLNLNSNTGGSGRQSQEAGSTNPEPASSSASGAPPSTPSNSNLNLDSISKTAAPPPLPRPGGDQYLKLDSKPKPAALPPLSRPSGDQKRSTSTEPLNRDLNSSLGKRSLPSALAGADKPLEVTRPSSHSVSGSQSLRSSRARPVSSRPSTMDEEEAMLVEAIRLSLRENNGDGNKA